MNVTTLIPAYKPKYLHDLLIALKYQTVKPTRIIISDDSPDRAFRTALSSEPMRSAIADMNIEVIDGPRAGAYANILHLLDAWNGSTPLVHMLFDDDVIYPEFYASHVAVQQTNLFGCSISRRWTATESGQPVGQLPRPDAVAQHSSRVLSLDPGNAFLSTVPACNNWFGEFSNTVFNQEVAGLLRDPRMAGISYLGLADIGLFLTSSLTRPLCLINESLGYFRMNPEQTTQQRSSHAYHLAVIAWAALAVSGVRLGKLSRDQAAQTFRIVQSFVINLLPGSEHLAAFGELLRNLIEGAPSADDRFVEAWHAFISARSLVAQPIPATTHGVL